MPSTYTGNPTAAQSPSPAPNPTNPIILNLPTDGDDLNVSSILQALKAVGDWIMWLVGLIIPIQGVRTWSATTTYALNDMVVGPDHLTYKSSVGANLNNTPASSSGAWDRWGHTPLEVQQGTVIMDSGTSGISCTNGASVSTSFVSKYNDDIFRRVDFTIDAIPAGSNTTVDLSGSSTKFASYVKTGSCSLLSGGHAYGGQCGMQINIGGGPNVLTVWHYKNPGDPDTAVSVAVSLLGA